MRTISTALAAALTLALATPALADPRATVKRCASVTVQGDEAHKLRGIAYPMPVREIGTGKVKRWRRWTIRCRETRTVVRKWLKNGFNELEPGVMYGGNAWACSLDNDGTVLGRFECTSGLYGRITGSIREAAS
jgi:hypothetical protein